MLNIISEKFVKNIGTDFEVLYNQVKDIVPNISKWQYSQGYYHDEENDINVLFLEEKVKQMVVGYKIVIDDVNNKENTKIRMYNDKFFFEKIKLNDEEDSMRYSAYLLDLEDYIKKVFSFVCNDDYITLGIDVNKHTKDTSISIITNLNQEKVEQVLGQYDVLNVRKCEKVDVTKVLEEVYMKNFYYEYPEGTIDNKITDVKVRTRKED